MRSSLVLTVRPCVRSEHFRPTGKVRGSNVTLEREYTEVSSGFSLSLHEYSGLMLKQIKTASSCVFLNSEFVIRYCLLLRTQNQVNQ